MAGTRRGLTGLHTAEHRRLMATLAEARVSAGLTQRAFAERLGVDQSYIAKYETGRRRIDVIEFLRIVAALGVEPIDVLNRVQREA